MSAPARRELVAVIAVVAAGAGSAAAVAQATWVHVHLRTGVGTVVGAPVQVDVRGADAVPALVPLALLALAGAVGLVAARGLARRVVAVLVAAAGAAVAGLSVRVLVDPASVVAGALRAQSLDATLSRAAGTTTDWWWPVLAAAGGVAVLAGGLVAVVRSGRWPAMGARYDAPTGRERGSGPPPDAWSALDRGEDPTVEDASGAAGPRPDLPE